MSPWVEKQRLIIFENKMEEIYLTEQSIKELLEGKDVYNDDTIIHPPKTNELGLMRKKLKI